MKLTSLSAIKNQRLAQTIIIKYGVVITTLILFIIFSFVSPSFITIKNIFNLINNVAITGILALGLTAVLIVGEYDISFAANATICSIISIALLRLNVPLVPTWLIVVFTGLFIGFVNSLSIIYIGVPSFVSTVGMMSIILGLANTISKGAVISSPRFPPGFTVLGRQIFWGVVPSSVIWFAIITILMIYLLEYTVIGREMYAVGGNKEAAIRVGINVKRIKLLAFIIIGFLSGVCGAIIGSRYGAGNPRIETSFQFPSIVAAFMGAVSLREGLPNPTGTVTAVLLISVIQNGLVLIGAPLFIKEMTLGILMLFSVTVVASMKNGNISSVAMNF